MQSKTFPRLAIATAVTAVCTPVAAQEASDDQQLDPVVVTATRTPQTVDETLSAVTVLSREDIDRSQAVDLPSLLSRQPGLNVVRNGSFGQNSSLFIRGTNSDQSLVMIDGQRIGSATLGTTSFQHLPLDNLERVEIVRGPRSSIYGADAIGGVVQMSTRGEEMFEGQRLRGGLMAGGNNTNEVSAGIDAGDGEREISITGRSFDTDGIKASEDSVGDNGTENDSASLRYAQRINERTQWRVNALHARGTAESGGSADSDAFTDFVQQAISTELDIEASEAWRVKLRAGQSKDESDFFGDDREPRNLTSRFDTAQQQVSWTNELHLGERHQVIAGIDARDDNVDSTTDFKEDSRYNVGAFGVYVWDGERTDFEASVRQDDNEAFGDSTTGGLAGGYRIGETTRVRASVGTAFNAPTFNDLFFPFQEFDREENGQTVTDTFEGNPDLDPEESTSYEIGLEGGRDWRWGINAFRTEIDDLIVNSSEGSFLTGFDTRPDNVDEATIDGVELSATAVDYDGWRIQATATFLDAIAEGQDGDDDTDLPRRPDRKFTLDVDRDIGAGNIGFSLRNEGERFDDAANNTKLDDFTVVDLRAGYRLSSEVRLRGSLVNATDEDYQTADGFNTLGRTFFVRLDYGG